MIQELTGQATLTIPKTGQIIPLTREVVTIGRKGDKSIVLEDDPKVSRYHATIYWQDGDYLLEDANSSNGTFLNRQRLAEPRRLRDGDEIQVGDTLLRVQLLQDVTKPSLKPPPFAGVDATMVSSSSPVPEAAAMRDSQPPSEDNPYVGPRTFTQEEGDRFFGRDREAQELFSLVVSERLVLFYAQSGAGKSSLINARLVPMLREAGYPVLPIGRVSGELPEGVDAVDNIYVFNLLLSLDESDGDPRRFTEMSLSKFLARLTSIDGQHYFYEDPDATEPTVDETVQETPYVLILDQFEEIITTHPAHWEERRQFFEQLNQAMTDDPMLWAILTLREDYLAPLETYAPLVPTNMRARFYMQRMRYESALEAIKRPAEGSGRPFGPDVAENLVDNLRQIKIQGGQTELGQFVEPVQLQVVCYQLWERLKKEPPGQISQQNLDELGDVDEALGHFYEQALAETVDETGISEIELRNWFDTELITEAGTKGTVYRGPDRTGGIANEAVDLLVSKFVLRSEARSGGTWYELVHDRFVEPIIKSNRDWRLKQPLIQIAQSWEEADRSAGLLLEGQPLREALASNWQGLGPLVREFLTASQTAQREKAETRRRHELEKERELAEERRKRIEEQEQRIKEQAEANTKLRRRFWLIMLTGAIAVFLAFIGGTIGYNWWQEFDRRFQAETTATVAVEKAATAEQQAVDSAEMAAVNEEKADSAEGTAAAQKTVSAINQATAEALSTRSAIVSVTVEALNTASAANAAEAQELLAEQDSLLTVVAEATALRSTLVAEAAATADSIQATQTAVAAVTPTPQASSPTVVIQATTPGPTETATPTATATPDVPATQTAVAQAYATQTAEARRVCQLDPHPDLLKAWSQYRAQLGCPQQKAIGGFFAEQPFENGYMFWSEILDVFFVVVGEADGVWYRIEQKEVATYNPSGPACDAPEKIPADRYQPVRGFGGIWCEREDIREAIGWATAEERGTGDDLLQTYANGTMLRRSDGAVYVLFTDESRSYRLVE